MPLVEPRWSAVSCRSGDHSVRVWPAAANPNHASGVISCLGVLLQLRTCIFADRLSMIGSERSVTHYCVALLILSEARLTLDEFFNANPPHDF
jgi:hypothetical protein